MIYTGKITLEVNGLTCGHCAASVREELEEIPGVASVEVDVRKGATSKVAVDLGGEVTDAAIRDAISEAGYELVGVSTTS